MTSAKVNIGTMSARLRAINNHLPQLEAALEQLVTAISKECNTKGIIKQEVYFSLIKSSKSRKEKDKSLVYHTWQIIRQDDKNVKYSYIFWKNIHHVRMLLGR